MIALVKKPPGQFYQLLVSSFETSVSLLCWEVGWLRLHFYGPLRPQMSGERGHWACVFKGMFFWESNTTELFCVCDEATFAEQLISIFYKPLQSKSQPWSILIQAHEFDSGWFWGSNIFTTYEIEEWFFCWAGAQKREAVEEQLRTPSEIWKSVHILTTSSFQTPKTRVKEKYLKKKVFKAEGQRDGRWEIATYFWKLGSRWDTNSSLSRAENVQNHVRWGRLWQALSPFAGQSPVDLSSWKMSPMDWIYPAKVTGLFKSLITKHSYSQFLIFAYVARWLLHRVL